jgi:hypothetical protein
MNNRGLIGLIGLISEDIDLKFYQTGLAPPLVPIKRIKGIKRIKI